LTGAGLVLTGLLTLRVAREGKEAAETSDV
jgi:hypothetical protein